MTWHLDREAFVQAVAGPRPSAHSIRRRATLVAASARQRMPSRSGVLRRSSPSARPGLAVDEIFERHEAATEAIIAGERVRTVEEPFGHDTLRGVDVCPHGPGRMNCEHEDCIEWRSHGRAR